MSKFMVAVGAAALALATPTIADPGGEHGGGGDEHGDQGEHSHFKGGGGHHGEDGEDSYGEGRVYRGENGGDDSGRAILVRRDGEQRYYGPAFAGREYGHGYSRQRQYAYGRDQQRFPVRLGAPLQQSYADSYLPGLFRSWYPDNDRYYYRYGDGNAYRVNRNDNLVSGLFPLANSDYYAPGEPYPASYDFYNVPQPYQRYYPDNGPYNYRYGDGAIYQVNRSNGIVESIVALLTGGGLGGSRGGPGGGLASLLGGLGGLGIGQPLPAGYDAYNVPDAYRDRYYDTPSTNYRYANGSIYQVDPKTQIIQQIISALT